MANSQNGWPVYTSAPSGHCKWITGRVAPGDVETVFNYLGDRFNSEVEPITVGHSWGWANRAIRGSSSTSNHASATAVDLNAPKHPLGKSGTFSAAQVKKIQAILRDLGGAIRWGGNYSGRKDEMHFEVNTSKANLAKVAASIRKGEKPKPVGGASGGGGSSFESATAKHSVGSRVMRLHSGGTDVKWLQKRLYKAGYTITPKSNGDFDALFGSEVEKAVKALQAAAGITVDGDAGKDTIKAAKAAKVVRQLPKVTKPKAPVKKVYAFPFSEPGAYIGPKSGPNRSHSGLTGRKSKGVADSTWIKRFVNALVERGWNAKKGGTYLTRFGNDGNYGAELEALIRAFQKDQGLPVDGLAGKTTWDAAFNNPIT